MIERLLERYAWAVDVWVWMQIVGAVLGMAFFGVMAVWFIRLWREM